jgi:C1A family cysteine protease
MMAVGDMPERVDPRQSDLYKSGWLKVENQGAIGSCQGASLTNCMEFCYGISTGKFLELSKMHAYLKSQRFDGIVGDRGSTLSGGTKAARAGVCREAIAPYPRAYPGASWVTPAMEEDGKNYILRSHTNINNSLEAKEFIASGKGLVQAGTMWGNEMTPDSRGVIKSFSGRSGGGHAWVLLGYVPDEDVGSSHRDGYYFVLRNTWGNWGDKGDAYVPPSVLDQMIRHNFSVFIGRSDMETPDVRNIPHDFTAPGKGIRV